MTRPWYSTTHASAPRDDEEDYGFDYEDDEGSEPDASLENQYYNAKAMKDDDPRAALDSFKGVLETETDKGEWGFKALKQMVKVAFSCGLLDRSLESYRQLLAYAQASSAVTKNYTEKSITNLIDYISHTRDVAFLESFFGETLAFLEGSPNERLWLKSNLKMANLMLEKKEYPKFSLIIRALRKTCESDGGLDDSKKGTQLLEILSLEILFYNETQNTKKLKVSRTGSSSLHLD